MESFQTRWTACAADNERLRRDVTESREGNAKLRQKCALLEEENSMLQARNQELEKQVAGVRARQRQQVTTLDAVIGNYWIFLQAVLERPQCSAAPPDVTEHTAAPTTRSAVSGFQALERLNSRLLDLSKDGANRSDDTQLHVTRTVTALPRTSSSSEVSLSPNQTSLGTSVFSLPPSPDTGPRKLAAKARKTSSVRERRQLSPLTAQADVSRGFVVAGLTGFGHVTHPLDLHTPRESRADVTFRHRAHSDAKRERAATVSGARRFPMTQSFTTDDERVVGRGVTRACLSNDSSPRNKTKLLVGGATGDDVCALSDDDAAGRVPRSRVLLGSNHSRTLSDNDVPVHHTPEATCTGASGADVASHTSTSSGLWSRRNGITAMPVEVSMQLRMSDVKKSKAFSELMDKFVKDKDGAASPQERKFSPIKRFSRKKAKSSKS